MTGSTNLWVQLLLGALIAGFGVYIDDLRRQVEWNSQQHLDAKKRLTIIETRMEK